MIWQSIHPINYRGNEQIGHDPVLLGGKLPRVPYSELRICGGLWSQQYWLISLSQESQIIRIRKRKEKKK